MNPPIQFTRPPRTKKASRKKRAGIPLKKLQGHFILKTFVLQPTKKPNADKYN
jgi:hypothetical protein